MASPPIPEGFSFSLGSPPTEPEKLSSALLKNAHSPTFPFLKIKLISNETENNGVVEIKIPPLVYSYIKSNFLTDEIILYVSQGARFGIWSYDMTLSFNIMSSLGIIDNLQEWIKTAHVAINDSFKEEKINSSRDNPQALEKIIEILTSMNLIDQVKANSLLITVAKDVINAKEMDPNTIIYRLCMAIFHAKNRSGVSPIPILEDGSELYLKLSQGDVIKKYSNEFSPLMELPGDSRIQVSRVFFTLLVASYYYYTAIGDDSI